jgi:hypothetical protein
MSIVLMINYARSGGTILSKCLGSLEDTIVISEVNPLRSAKFSVKEQASKWYGIDLKRDDYLGSVLELHEICENNNKKLIIRDWSFVNFTPSSLNNYDPSGKLSNLETLKKEVETKAFCFIRDAIDIWISRWQPPEFFPYYKNYLHEVLKNNIPIFKYEDFCMNPESSLKEICQNTGLNFSGNYKNYAEYNKTTGDNTTSVISRGEKNKMITLLKRKKLPVSVVRKLNSNADMIECNQILQYSTNYSDREIEETESMFLLELKYRIKKLLKIPTKDQY